MEDRECVLSRRRKPRPTSQQLSADSAPFDSAALLKSAGAEGGGRAVASRGGGGEAWEEEGGRGLTSLADRQTADDEAARQFDRSFNFDPHRAVAHCSICRAPGRSRPCLSTCTCVCTTLCGGGVRVH